MANTTQPIKTEPTQMDSLMQMITQVSGTLQTLDKKIDNVADKQAALEMKVVAVEAKSNGKDAGFESDLKKGKAVQFDLTETEKSYYGEPASPKLMEIVQQVLGHDFAAFVKANEIAPYTFFTLVVPERFLGIQREFHSSPCLNFKLETDVRKWCETVKTWLFSQYRAVGKQEAPTFNIVSRN